MTRSVSVDPVRVSTLKLLLSLPHGRSHIRASQEMTIAHARDIEAENRLPVGQNRRSLRQRGRRQRRLRRIVELPVNGIQHECARRGNSKEIVVTDHDVIIAVLVVINKFEEEIYVRRVGGEGEAIYVEPDSVRRGRIALISHLLKWVGIHRGRVGIDAGNGVTGRDSIVKKVIGIVNETHSRRDLDSDLGTTCARGIPH